MGTEGNWNRSAWELASNQASWLYTNTIFPVAEWCFEHQEIVAVGAACVILGGSALLMRKNYNKLLRKMRRLARINRGNTMTRKEFRRLQIRIAGDVITSALEDAIVDGKLKPGFVNFLYRQLAFVLDNKDLKPRKLQAKDQLSNVEAEELLKLLYNKKRMNIPGGKPGEVDNVHVYSKGAPTPKDTKRKFGDTVRRKA